MARPVVIGLLSGLAFLVVLGGILFGCAGALGPAILLGVPGRLGGDDAGGGLRGGPGADRGADAARARRQGLRFRVRARDPLGRRN